MKASWLIKISIDRSSNWQSSFPQTTYTKCELLSHLFGFSWFVSLIERPSLIYIILCNSIDLEKWTCMFTASFPSRSVRNNELSWIVCSELDANELPATLNRTFWWIWRVSILLIRELLSCTYWVPATAKIWLPRFVFWLILEFLLCLRRFLWALREVLFMEIKIF